MSEDRAARREAAVFVALITAAVLAAPFAPEGTAAVVIVVVAGAVVTRAHQRVYFREVVARYHATPFGRLCTWNFQPSSSGLSVSCTSREAFSGKMIGS